MAIIVNPVPLPLKPDLPKNIKDLDPQIQDYFKELDKWMTSFTQAFQLYMTQNKV